MRVRRGILEFFIFDGRVCNVIYFERLVEVMSGLEGMKWFG